MFFWGQQEVGVGVEELLCVVPTGDCGWMIPNIRVSSAAKDGK